MGDKPDDVPSLEELGADDPLPEYWSENTTITVSRHTKESLNAHRDGRPWDQYLELLRRGHADPITFNDVDRMAEVLSDELSVGLEYDDVKNACAAALREELPEGQRR